MYNKEEKITNVTVKKIDRTTYEIWGDMYCPCYDVKKVVPYIIGHINTPTNSFYGSNNGSFSESGQWAWQEKNMEVIKEAFNVWEETGLTPRQLQKENETLTLELQRVRTDLIEQLRITGNYFDREKELKKQRDELLKEVDKIKHMTNSSSVRKFLISIQKKYSGKLD